MPAVVVAEEVPASAAAHVLAATTADPANAHEALSSPHAEEWSLAMDAEMEAMLQMDVLEYVPLSDVPPGKTPLPAMMIFKTKYLSDGSVDRRKARLVVKGYAQKHGEDFYDVFAPVARFPSLRILLALAAANDWQLRQFDVTTAFLYAPLQEEIYMQQPPGYERAGPNGEAMVCKLKKSLYGLKQAPRNWYQHFSEFLVEYGFKKSEHDPCVFLYHEGSQLKCMLIVYVDDVPSGVAAEAAWYQQFIHAVEAKFKIKEGPLEYCLGLQVEQTDGQVKVHQSKYAHDVLERFQMTNCNPVSTPLEPGTRLSCDDDGQRSAALKAEYRRLIGSLMYLAVGTRPDLALTLSKLSRVLANPTATHMRVAKRVLRYLRGTLNLGLVYRKTNMQHNVLVGYADADWAGCVDTRRSTTGWFFRLNGGPVSWLSKLQSLVALSTTEAEYVALCSAGCEAVYLRGLLQEIGFGQPASGTPVHEDNFGCVQLTKDSVHHTRTKHIDIRHHKIRELVEHKVVDVVQCPTEHMVADALTKPLARVRFLMLRPLLMGT